MPPRSKLDINAIGEAGSILAVVAPGFKAGDLHSATGRVQKQGYAIKIASTVDSLVEGEGDKGDTLSFVVDSKPGDARPDDYDGLVIPGGERHLSALENHPAVPELIRAFVEAKKPVLAWADAAPLLAPYSREPEKVREAAAAVAVNGEIYPAETEEARDDAAEVFMKVLGLNTAGEAA